jgi:hypothetical protein
MTTPDTGTATEAVTIHQSATESMRQDRKFAESRKIDAMIQPVQMIPAIAHGPASARRLIRKAADHCDGWIMATDYNDMTEKLRALFWNDSCADLMAEDIPMFLSRKLTGLDGKRMGVDDAEAAGLLLTDGDAVPLLRRLRGVHLDVLRALALACRNDDLVQLIDGGTVTVGGIWPPAPAEQDERNEVQAPVPVQVDDGLPPVTTTELAAALNGLNDWNETTWRNRLGSASGRPWLLAARLTPGTQGGSAATWNPVIVASELVKRSPGHKRYVLGRFQSNDALKPWLDQLYEHVPSITEPT